MLRSFISSLRKDILAIILILFLIVSLFITINLVKKRLDLRPRAGIESLPSLTLTSGKTNLSKGVEFTVNLMLDPKAKNVSGVEAHLVFPKDAFEVVATPDIGPLFPTKLQNEYSNTNGTIDIAAGIALPTPPTTTTPTPNVVASCQTLIDKINAAFDKSCGQTGYDKIADVTKNKTVDVLDLTLVGGHAGDDAWCNEKLTNETDPCLNPSSSPVPPTTSPVPDYNTVTVTPQSFNFIKSVNAQTDPILVATIKLKTKTNTTLTSGEIGFSSSQPSIVTEVNNPVNVLGNTNNITFTIGTVDANTPIINFRIRFEGMVTGVDIDTERLKWLKDNYPTQKVIVRVKKGDFFKEFKDVTVTLDTVTVPGTYKGLNIPLVGVPAGTGYNLYVKGPKHLARGFSNVELSAGLDFYPLFDWAQSSIQPGDLPPQDGVVNSLDFSRIVDLLEKSEYTQEDLDKADLNYDNTINGGDTTLILNTLQEKYDEDTY